jgi:acyl-CoA synthetase (AMP-forming)/AMP-acid ligase II/thioesterase domain-containing protein
MGPSLMDRSVLRWVSDDMNKKLKLFSMPGAQTSQIVIMLFQSLLHLLEAIASREPTRYIITYSIGNTHTPEIFSYSDLLQSARKAAGALRFKYHVVPGSVVLLHLNDHWNSMLWFWATLIADCIPAMSTPFSNNPETRLRHLKHLSTTLRSPKCLTTASLAAEFAGQEYITPICVQSLDYENLVPLPIKEGGDIAVLMFTSGSSGHCKVVPLTHEQILASLSGKAWTFPLPDNTAQLNWVGMDHVASLVEVHLFSIYTHSDQVHIPTVEVLSHVTLFLDLIHRHRVSRTFAPNFFLAKLRAALSADDILAKYTGSLSSLRYIVSGGEANVTQTINDLAQMLKKCGAVSNVIVPAFGMTETCAGAIYNTLFPQYDVEHGLPFASVGSCMPGIQVRIVQLNGNGNSVPPGTVGNLEICGPVVLKGYFNNPAATKSTFTNDNWFKTGDLAFVDDNGMLVLAGREKDSIIVNGANYSPHDIESAIDEANFPGLISGFTCCFSTFPPSADTEEVIIVYLPNYTPADTVRRSETAAAIRKVAMMSVGVRATVLPLDRAMLEKSTLGKLSRGKIKAAYERGDYKSYQEANEEMLALHHKVSHHQPRSGLEQSLLGVFTSTIPENLTEEFDVLTSIFDLGITSIELLKLKRGIEDLIGHGQIPLITLMTNPTIRTLSDALKQHAQQRDCSIYNPVVVLQSQGKKPPIWLVHPVGGEVMIFMNLAKFIMDRPVYGLRARGFNDGEDPFHTFEEIVSKYHASIKEKQPSGPYAIAGYSYGAKVAFDIAKALEHNGDEVRFLGLLDLPPSLNGTQMRAVAWKEMLLHICRMVGVIREEGIKKIYPRLEPENISPRHAIETVMGEADVTRLAELGLTASALERWANLTHALQRCIVDHKTNGSVAGADAFYCDPMASMAISNEQWACDYIGKWSDHTRSPPRFHHIAGTHYTILDAENIFSFQKTFLRALNDRGI